MDIQFSIYLKALSELCFYQIEKNLNFLVSTNIRFIFEKGAENYQKVTKILIAALKSAFRFNKPSFSKITLFEEGCVWMTFPQFPTTVIGSWPRSVEVQKRCMISVQGE